MVNSSFQQNYFTRDHIIVYGGLTVLFLMGWAYMGYMAWAMQNMDVVEMWMPPMTDTRAWELYDFWMLILMWVVMMIAMMTPSILPMVSLFVTVSRRKREKDQTYVSTLIFLGGYLIAWVLFSVVISLVQYPLHLGGWLNPMMNSRSYLLSGGILVLAGLYQWTPFKDACLKQCRTPLNFLMTCWREGNSGAIRMGLLHGFYCIGCCWALMAVMFAVGVMNVLWMMVIAIFVLAEKISRFSALLFRVISGTVLVIWGVYWLSLYPW